VSNGFSEKGLWGLLCLAGSQNLILYLPHYRAFSHDVISHGGHIGAPKNNETAVTLVFQTSPVGVKLSKRLLLF